MNSDGASTLARGANPKMKTNFSKPWIVGMLYTVAALAPVAMTGCQVSYGGQTLPSPYYLKDDIQYYEKGPEFKLSKEVAAMKQYEEEQEMLGN